MEKLKTIQTKENLNEVYRLGEPGPGGAFHDYVVVLGDAVECPEEPEQNFKIVPILFQKGPRKDPDTRHGALDCDLLEIVRDRLKAFQAGPFACDENARALMYLEQALIQMNLRVENRIQRGVLGTTEK